jgi:hypothetical protein
MSSFSSKKMSSTWNPKMSSFSSILAEEVITREIEQEKKKLQEEKEKLQQEKKEFQQEKKELQQENEGLQEVRTWIPPLTLREIDFKFCMKILNLMGNAALCGVGWSVFLIKIKLEYVLSCVILNNIAIMFRTD